ncbi:MAG: pentapeptide repeat-containing protein [Pirellulales bacterium]|nr:pentapeptide repeat-containing protein [Pirellulales bacterium]
MMRDDYGRLYYSVSRDALHWTLLGGGKRIHEAYRGHPDVCRGHDGRYYMTGGSAAIVLWVSDDLVTWSKLLELEPDLRQTADFQPREKTYGAPKIYYDESVGQHLITWHTSQNEKRREQPEHYWAGQRTLYVLSRDLKTFTQPKRLFPFDMATIDVIVRKDHGQYYAILKDERYPSFDWPTGKSIRISRGESLTGPWTEPSPRITPNFREAPTLIPRPDGKGWYLYCEQYPGVQYSLCTAPRVEGPWHDVYIKDYHVPAGSRHGCMIRVTQKQYDGIVAAATPVTMVRDPKTPQALFACQEIQEALEARGHRVRQLDSARLDQAHFDQAHFDQAHLDQAHLDQAHLDQAHFDQAHFDQAHLDQAHLDQAHLGQAHLGQDGDGAWIVLGSRSDAALGEKMKRQGIRLPGTLRPEGYSLRTTRNNGRSTYWVVGADAAGAMYGGLELAERVRIAGLAGIGHADHNAYMAMRGTKFNCPLDVRTPSYTDVCDAAQHNIAEMWSFDFWKEYVDQLARCRYNYVSLWSLHPFPSLVKVPDYPNVALDNVQRSTVRWKEYYSLNGIGFDSPEILGNVEILKRMTIDEKIAFWRRVMRYGKDRNVDFYFVTWNIFVNGTGGQYGITDDIGNPTTVDYFRKSIRQMFLTYPDLAGIGLTTGENMEGASLQQKEDWAFQTYGQGVLDAAAEQPGRKITLIHRQHQTGTRDIARTFAPLVAHKDIEFLFSFKYAKAHVYSATTQPYHRAFVQDIGELKTIWTLRNDDVYHFRWGAPDFVREFIQNIPREASRGYYLGSDQYIWGREFLSTEPETPRQIEVAKHWYHWMIWGRLGYDPTLANERFIAVLQQRYPNVSGKDLFAAWQEASMVFPTTTGFHWGALDFQWYIEACKSSPGPAQTPTGFHDVNRFITLPPHPSSGNISIPDFVDLVVAGKQPSGTTPLEVSQKLHRHAEKALELVDGLSHGGDKELRLTLSDIRAMGLLGKYYAHKIRGATELALFRKTRLPAHGNTAVAELTEAADCWRRYVSTALAQYENPLWTNRVGYCDWRELTGQVLHDVEIAGGTPRLSSMAPTPGGTILEAEAATFQGLAKASHGGEFTGTGYLDPTPDAPRPRIHWTFDAPQTGTYLLELRYALAGQGQHRCGVTVNGNRAGKIVCWLTGGRSTWAWDQRPVVLEEGPNAIELTPEGPVAIDHLNVLFGGATASASQ